MSHLTQYSYDVLGNLCQVQQGAQTRSFMYDSLSRLLRVNNPEQQTDASFATLTGAQWTMTYVYDNNSNLLTRKSIRDDSGVATVACAAYGYDALNRNTSVTYTKGSGNVPDPQSPNIIRKYDNLTGGAYGRGRLYKSYSGGDDTTGSNVERTMITAYDVMGRPLTQSQGFKINGAWTTSDFTVNNTYDCAGNLCAVKYPGQREIKTDFSAAGRISGESMRPDATSAWSTLVSNLSYEPFGGLAMETLGNSLIHCMTYNLRLQPTSIKLGNNSPDYTSVFKQEYLYGTAVNLTDADASIQTNKNNGNIARLKYSIGSTVKYAQTFKYDDLNRLLEGQEHTAANYGAMYAWKQQFDYDRYGNRGMNAASTLNGNALRLGSYTMSATQSGNTETGAGSQTEENQPETNE